MEALVAAGWPAVSERILAGLSHDLNGRVWTLPVLVEALDEADGTRRPEWRGYLDEELAKLGETARLVQLLAQPAVGVEVVELRRFMPDVLALHRRHRGLEHAPVRIESGGTPGVAVRVDPALLTRFLLLLLADAGWRRKATEEGEVLVSVRSDGRTATVGVHDPSRTTEPPGDSPLKGPNHEVMERAASVLGGRLDVQVTERGRAVELTLETPGRDPSLDSASPS